MIINFSLTNPDFPRFATLQFMSVKPDSYLTSGTNNYPSSATNDKIVYRVIISGKYIWDFLVLPQQDLLLSSSGSHRPYRRW